MRKREKVEEVRVRIIGMCKIGNKIGKERNSNIGR